MSGTVGGTTGLTVSPTTITITDNDVASTAVSLSAAPSTVGEGDGATDVTITAALDGAARTQATTVTLSLGGTATGSGTDYTAGSLPTITIAASATSATGTLSITPADDRLLEGDETIQVSGTVGGATGLTVSPATITITDDDVASTRVSLSAAPSTVGEGDGAATSVTITAALNGAARTQATMVTLSLGGTATGSGADYTAGALPTITIAASATSATGTLSITPADDRLLEGDETIQVSGTVGGTTGLTVSPTTITITDNDVASTAVSLSVNPSTVGEADGATSVTITAALNGAVRTEATTVTLSLGGTATGSGTDYTAGALPTITIASSAASATGTLSITPIDDSLVEGDETIQVSGSVSGGTASLTVSPATITITDNDTSSPPSPPPPGGNNQEPPVRRADPKTSDPMIVLTEEAPVGGRVTISGSNFAALSPLTVKIVGTFTVTPTPAPETDKNGAFEVNFRVPYLEVGSYTVTVSDNSPSRNSATESFSIDHPVVSTPAEVFGVLGANLMAVWQYDNATDSWSFYSPRQPSELDDLTGLARGDIVWIELEETAEFQGATLNAGWNLVVLK